MNGLGVILIATGNYMKFVSNIIRSTTQNIGYRGSINFYIFTDLDNMNIKFDSNVRLLEYNFINWPYPTLMRYKGISTERDILAREKHLLYLDVDMKVNLNCEELFDYNIFAVRHPGHKVTNRLPFESNKDSAAYIDSTTYSTYVCGGVQGGISEAYLDAAESIHNKIDLDLKNNHIAKWHDESYWNKYVYENRKIKVLSSQYCWPEQWQSNNAPGKIIALKKNHLDYRNDKNFYKKAGFFLSDIRMKLIRPRSY